MICSVISMRRGFVSKTINCDRQSLPLEREKQLVATNIKKSKFVDIFLYLAHEHVIIT